MNFIYSELALPRDTGLMLPKKRGGGSQVKGLREFVLIHDLKKEGLSIAAIARKVGCDRKTVRKYLEQGLEAPVYGPEKFELCVSSIIGAQDIRQGTIFRELLSIAAV